jgi:hypothetical protein
MTTCPYCHSDQILERLLFHVPGHAGGLVSFKDKDNQWTWDSEKVLADLCKKCGTIVRLYVDNTNHPIWDTVEKK